MNTIPTTLDARRVGYTIVGGGKGRVRRSGAPVSVVLLGRGSRLHRAEQLRDLEKAGFVSIISVEKAGESVEVESLASLAPSVRYLLVEEEVTDGEKVNIAVRESPEPYVFVVRDGMRLSTSTLSSRFFERLSERALLCATPVFSTPKGDAIPSLAFPAFDGSSIRFIVANSAKDDDKNAYPFDYCGIYHREKFSMLGGYDWTLRNPHWQKLDFGLRAWLWGEEIRSLHALKLLVDRDMPADDSTTDADYVRFYLKNLAPAYRSDQGVLPWSRALPFCFGSGLGPIRAFSEFLAARAWVGVNRYRFKLDARALVDLWEPLS